MLEVKAHFDCGPGTSTNFIPKWYRFQRLSLLETILHLCLCELLYLGSSAREGEHVVSFFSQGCLEWVHRKLIPPQEQFLKDFPQVLGPADALDTQYGGVVLPAISLLWQVGLINAFCLDAHAKSEIACFKQAALRRANAAGA
ncbi:MAG: hypothetical protein Q9213_001523 [Squamulea squamosa]